MKIFKSFGKIFEKPSVISSSQGFGEKLIKVKSRYGDDFSAFLYSSNVDKIIKDELLPFLEAPEHYNGFLDQNHWIEKHPFNFPGPFYTGQSDSCGTGDVEAPDNVMYDSNCFEYIFKQPSSFEELLSVFDAAAVGVFDSYSCNGNHFWTYNLCKEWWRRRHELIEQLNTDEVKKMNSDRVQLYLDYLDSDAEVDLRRYCFFLENNYYPASDSVLLPDL